MAQFMIFFHGNFKKQYKKLSKNDQERLSERLNIFKQNPFNPILHNHELRGKYSGLNSINITGDLRALYQPVSDNLVLFVAIDTHSNLYE